MYPLKKAETLDDVYGAFRNEPLSVAEIDAFYQETEAARGENPRQKLAWILRKEPLNANHFLFVGYKGCGKSTELNHLEKDIQGDFLVLNFSVVKELDPVHLNYIELFIVLMEHLFRLAEENGIQVSAAYLKRVQNWIATEEIEQIKEKYIGLEAEAGVDWSIPFFTAFFAKFKTAARTSASLKDVLKRNVEPKLSQLIEHCNDLIREVELDLHRIDKKGLVIIIEDLDKIPIDRAQELFANYTHQLIAIKANIIFTFPISLKNSIHFTRISGYFSVCVELPMIEVMHRDGSENEVAIAALVRIVEERMSLSLFQSAQILRQMILDSGGCIRDLFRMIRDAGYNGISQKRLLIDEADRHKAFLSLRKDYSNTISDNIFDGRKIEVQRYFDVLVTLAKSKNKDIENSEELMHLRDNLCVLGYNGEGWMDVHPVVKQILQEKGKWDGLRSAD